MTTRIHGHEVMQMMISSGKSYTRESLCAEIVDRFGDQARFHTCSADNMTAAELVDFLERRGKFTATDNGFTTDPSRVCNH